MRRAEVIYARADRHSNWAERVSDRVVGFFSERARGRRAHQRLLARDSDYGAAFRLAAAAQGRSHQDLNQRPTDLGLNQTPWLGLSDRDADGDQIPRLASRRMRSRQIEARDGIGAGIFRSRQRKVIGSGLRLQVRSGDDFVNDAFEEVWRERRDALYPAEGLLSDVAGQRLIFGRRDVDGDILVVPTVSAPGEPVWFEIVEGDRISTPINVDQHMDTGNKVIEGVEKDEVGRTVAYWVLKRHPGERPLGAWGRGNIKHLSRSVRDYVRIPFERGRLLRSRVSRPGQSRGLPLLHAVEQDIHDIDLLVLSTLKRAQIAACLTLFVTTDAALNDFFGEDGALPVEGPWGYDVHQRLRPGEFFRLAPGEKIETTASEGLAPDLEPFVWLFARRIGAAVDMSPHAILGDRGSISYSAARTIELEDRIIYDLERQDFARELLTWQAQLVWADAIRRGDPRLAFSSVEEAASLELTWIGDARHWVDPTKEVQAIETALALNLTTLRDEAAALGRDWEELARQRAREKELLAELGLTAAQVVAPLADEEPEVDELEEPEADGEPEGDEEEAVAA